MAIYNCKFIYIKGEDNTVADALSRYPHNSITDRAETERLAHHPYNYLAQEVCAVVRDNGIMKYMVAALTEPQPRYPLKTELKIDKKMIDDLKRAYKTDVWCQKLISTSKGMPELTVRDGLWFIGKRLCGPLAN